MSFLALVVNEKRKQQFRQFLCLRVSSSLPLRLSLGVKQELESNHAVLAGMLRRMLAQKMAFNEVSNYGVLILDNGKVKH